MTGGHTVAHTLAGGHRDVGCRDTASGCQQSVHLLRQDRSVRYIMNHHFRELVSHEVQISTSPCDHIFERATFDRVFFGQYVPALYAPGFAHRDPGAGSDQLNVLEFIAAELTHSTGHLQRLAPADTFGLGTLEWMSHVELPDITCSSVIDPVMMAI